MRAGAHHITQKWMGSEIESVNIEPQDNGSGALTKIIDAEGVATGSTLLFLGCLFELGDASLDISISIARIE